jgi:uncharacterized protein YkwD
MNNIKTTRSILSAVIMAATLGLSACGGGDSAKEARVDNRDNTCGIPNFNAEMLAQINAKRAAGAVCGADVMPSAKALAWNQNLQWAATRHAYDMGTPGFNLSHPHSGSDGSNDITRTIDSGYPYTSGTELAAGPGLITIDRALDAWMGSPGHCKGLMGASYKNVGVSCAGSFVVMVVAN